MLKTTIDANTEHAVIKSLLKGGPWPTMHDVLTVSVGLAAFVLSCLFVFSLFGRYFLLSELIASFRVQILVLLLISALGLLVLRHRRSGIVLSLVSAVNLGLLASVSAPIAQPTPGAERLTIMSMNVLCDNYQFDKVVDHVEEVAPDIFVVIEYSNRWQQGLRSLHKSYPYRLVEPRWHGYGIAIFSKRPLEDTEVWQLTQAQTDVPALLAKVSVGDRRLRLAGIHTMSPTSELRMKLRNDQMMEMASKLAKCDEPTILMGDFNCTPWSPFFGDMLAACGYSDSRRGQGYLASWNVDTPSVFWIPIDHALVSRNVHVHRRTTGDPCGSDHLPTIIEVSVSPH